MAQARKVSIQPVGSISRSIRVLTGFLATGSTAAIDYAWAPRKSKPDALRRNGERFARACETLDGAFLKLGQLLATRQDMLPPELLKPLERLQDTLSPLSFEQVRQEIERSLGRRIETTFLQFDEAPVASASIAQVHRARLQEGGGEVAVKLKRPGIESLMETDVRIFETVVRLAARLPLFRGIPLDKAVQQVCASLKAQTSFRKEAEIHQRFFDLFSYSDTVRIPRLFPDLCTEDLLVMEYVPDMIKITDPVLPAEDRRCAVAVGLRSLYEMIFGAGLIHCDLHPGNILWDPGGKVVILDFGFWAKLTDFERHAFAEFFLSIALNDGVTAARIVRETAIGFSEQFDATAFEAEIVRLVNDVSGENSGRFLVSRFVALLFAVQRNHGVYGSPAFTMAIVSLLVYEGIVRPLYPDLDFQREAVPFILQTLH